MTTPTPLSTAASEEDLVARLRDEAERECILGSEWMENLLREAANEIERLRQVAGIASDLVKALEAAKGYLMNARIDLETGAPKRTAITTIDGGIQIIDNALTRHRQGEK